MLRDPENFEEWTHEVYAPNLEVARVRCQNFANLGSLVEVLRVTQKTVTPNQLGEYKFICWLISEGDPTDASSNDS